MWIGGGHFGARHLIRNPLVDSAGDPMLRAIRHFFVIGHPLGANVNEWVEVVVVESE